MEFQRDPARLDRDCSSQLPTITSVSSKGCGGAVLRKMDEKVAQQPWPPCRKIEVKAQGRYVDSYMKLIKSSARKLVAVFSSVGQYCKAGRWQKVTPFQAGMEGVKITFTIPLTACSNIHRMLKLQHPAVIGENHSNVACYQVSLRGTNKWSANCPRSTGYGKAGGMWYTPPRKVWDLGTVQALGMQWCRTYGSKPYLSDFHQRTFCASSKHINNFETKSCQHMIQEIPIQALLQVKNLGVFSLLGCARRFEIGTILFLANGCYTVGWRKLRMKWKKPMVSLSRYTSSIHLHIWKYLESIWL